MADSHQVKLALFLMRITVFLVLFMWTLDKFINPQHAAAVWSKFYLIKGMEASVFTIIGALQMTVIVCFLLGIKKNISYLLVLLMHAVSTFSSYHQYLNPYEGANLLFFAAWPMLAACFALYVLRGSDTLLSLNLR